MNLLNRRIRAAAWEWAEHRELGTQVIHAVANAGGVTVLALLVAKIHVATPFGQFSLGWLFIALIVGYALIIDRLSAAIAAATLLLATGAWRGSLWSEHATGISDWLPLLLCYLPWGLTALLSHYVYRDLDMQHMGRPPGGRLLRVLRAVVLAWPDFLLFLLLQLGWRPQLRAELETIRPSFFGPGRQPDGSSRTWKNWAGNRTCTPRAFFYPKRPEELVEIVDRARAEGRRVRAVGTSYSWSPLVPTDAYLVNLRLFDQIELNLDDPARPLAIVGAGATGRDLNRVLEDAGYALRSNVVMESVSWGGMIAVGGHGSGYAEGTLSDMVHAIELVDGRGRQRRFERGVDNDDLMSAVCLALGSFGLIHRIELDIVPGFNVRLVDKRMPVAELLERLPELVPKHEYLDVFWFPGSPDVWLRTWDRCTAPARGPWQALTAPWSVVQSRSHWGRWWSFLHMVAANGGFRLGRLAPRLIPKLLAALDRMVIANERVVHIHEATHYRSCIETVRDLGCVEYGFAVDPRFAAVRQAWAAVERCIEAHAAAGRYPINLTVNLRFIGGSRCLLAPGYRNQHTCFIEALGDTTQPEWREAVDELAQAWHALPNARPHWPKQHADVPGIEAHVQRLLGPDLRRFLQLRAEADVDPDNMFVNAFVERMLLKPGARDRD